MARKKLGGGTTLVELHSDDDMGTLWAHQGDDDLPDPLTLKRGATPAPPRKDKHRGVHLNLWLTLSEIKRLRRLQKRGQFSFAAWVRHAMALDEQQRASDATGYIKRIVPEQVAIVAEQELIPVAEGRMALAERQTDWEAKRNLRNSAGIVMDTAAYFTSVRRDYERLARSAPAQSPASTTAET